MPSQLQRKPVNTYHHGDLREAMVRAALAEAERAGPEAISIKALAKRLGVSATREANKIGRAAFFDPLTSTAP